MDQLEKVLLGLGCCHNMVHDLSDSNCGACPYMALSTDSNVIACIASLHDDMIDLIKSALGEDGIRAMIAELGGGTDAGSDR